MYSDPPVDEKFNYNQVDNPSSHYLMNMNNLNNPNHHVSLNRLPTLAEILANRTSLPVDLSTFYTFMRDVESLGEYLDFWFDLVAHLNLCKHYIKCLRDSVTKRSAMDRSHNDLRFSSQQYNASTEDLNQGDSNRDSLPISAHKSLSSSILLGLISDGQILEDGDSHRLSRFLRGDIELEQRDSKIKELIGKYHHDSESRRNSASLNLQLNSKKVTPMSPPSPNNVYNSNPFAEAKDDPHQQVLEEVARTSKIGPELIEMLIKDSPFSESSSFITRQHLHESSTNLLLKYFVEDSEKYLNLPPPMHALVIKAIEVEGRDDPDVFRTVRDYIFNRIEHGHLPKFLNFMAIRNVNHSNLIRIIAGFFFCFVGFWISYVFLFLDYRKLLRPVIFLPYFIGFYLLVLLVYLIDPILVWFGFSETFSKAHGKFGLIKIRENFVHKVLIKRSLYVLLLVLLCTAALTILFSLIPGYRL